MFSVMRIIDISDNEATELIRNLTQFEEKFRGVFRKSYLNDCTYLLELPENHDWQDNQRKMLPLLKTFFLVFSCVKQKNTFFVIDTGVFLRDYTMYDSIDFSLSDEFLQLLSEFNIEFELSVYAAKFKSKVLDNDE